MFHHSQTPASPEKGNGVTLHISCQKNVIEPGRIVGPALENHSVRHGETEIGLMKHATSPAHLDVHCPGVPGPTGTNSKDVKTQHRQHRVKNFKNVILVISYGAGPTR